VGSASVAVWEGSEVVEGTVYPGGVFGSIFKVWYGGECDSCCSHVRPLRFSFSISYHLCIYCIFKYGTKFIK